MSSLPDPVVFSAAPPRSRRRSSAAAWDCSPYQILLRCLCSRSNAGLAGTLGLAAPGKPALERVRVLRHKGYRYCATKRSCSVAIVKCLQGK